MRQESVMRIVAVIVIGTALLTPSNDISPSHPPLSGIQDCAEVPTSSGIINVKNTGAKGDGRTDDTAAIQAAIDAIATVGGTVLVPDGTYLVDVTGKSSIHLKSNMTLKLSDGATLKAIANDSGSYAILSISGESDVTVIGGTLKGDREEHMGKSGEWGLGIRIDRGARHIVISGVTAKDMWGDGFYVQDAADVKFCGIVADNNRRQGLSIVEADGLLVTNSVFKHTRGTRPGAGIDLEPDHAAQKITNVRIYNSEFLDNAGAGIQIGGRGRIIRLEITHDVIQGNAYAAVLTDGTESRILSVAVTHNVFTTTVRNASRDSRLLIVRHAPEVIASAFCGN
jgi:hypothetical protein